MHVVSLTQTKVMLVSLAKDAPLLEPLVNRLLPHPDNWHHLLPLVGAGNTLGANDLGR